MGFNRIRDILDTGITTWESVNGTANLSRHGQSFLWATKDALLEATGHGKRLIQPEVIGQPTANQANLLIDLRQGFSGRRMPDGGPYIPDAQIQEIEDWIRAGCPD
jgi:hypothetical protein